MTEWQEIKSAPKNGKRLLLAYPNGTVKVGYWDEGGRYWAANQWLHEPPPTHWMPLPTHPLKSASATLSTPVRREGTVMKPSDLEEIRHAMNRLRAKASEGVTMPTSTVMNETAIVMDAIYRTGRAAPDLSELDRLRSSNEAATHRHKKRGSEYVLIGVGKMQSEDWCVETLGEDGDGRNAWVNEKVDMREVAIYRSVDDGSLWVRPLEEFEDGRFEALSLQEEEAR